MADLYFTYCNECHEQRDCLPHEDEFLCVGGDEGEGLDCYTRITAAQDVLRRERLEKAEADIRASQEAPRLAPASDSRNLTNQQKLDHPLPLKDDSDRPCVKCGMLTKHPCPGNEQTCPYCGTVECVPGCNY